MSYPLPPRIHRYAYMKLYLAHFERSCVMVTHKVADKSPVFMDFFRSCAVRYARRLHYRFVRTHIINYSDKPVVKHLERHAENFIKLLNQGT